MKLCWVGVILKKQIIFAESVITSFLGASFLLLLDLDQLPLHVKYTALKLTSLGFSLLESYTVLSKVILHTVCLKMLSPCQELKKGVWLDAKRNLLEMLPSCLPSAMMAWQSFDWVTDQVLDDLRLYLVVCFFAESASLLETFGIRKLLRTEVILHHGH